MTGRTNVTGMDIGIQHLRCFLTLAEEEHFTWAADRLGISQPTLSRQIRRLEETLGRALLDRSTRHPRLTAEGRRLQAELHILLPRLEAALRPPEPEAAFRLGYAWGFPRTLGRRAMEYMEEHHQVLVQPVRTDDRTAGLRDGAVDAALLWGGVTDPRLTSVEVLRDGRVAAVSRRSTLATRSTVTWRDIGRRCLVVNTVSGTLTPDDWPKSATPEIGAETTNIEEYLHAVAARRGVGVLPSSVAAQHPDPDVLYLPLTGAPPATLHYVRPRTDPHPHATTLQTALLSAASDAPARPVTHRAARRAEHVR
ncbi:LysR family transcriptional regulator [Streptomyces mexicanus]|uniref:LysR family transcriptional regulator n=1 Tax=Streptomyces mexicanus TaxID=178566 RepID=A0A7X1LPS6_9ACTN|nr:LysR family transcriptional regulator [Streptomyces mexicanus]MBC2863756.1 LysR family transcriptional regulator [Streptomyces mexicanus]